MKNPLTEDFSLEDLKNMPTISSGHFDNLKVDTGAVRVWLSRCGVADGMPYNNGVTVEKLMGGSWETVREYEAK